jgi:hypothetical protein
MLGGSILRPKLEAIVEMAGRHFVAFLRWRSLAGKRIAELLNLSDGYGALVTSGSSGRDSIGTGWHPYKDKEAPDSPAS